MLDTNLRAFVLVFFFPSSKPNKQANAVDSYQQTQELDIFFSSLDFPSVFLSLLSFFFSISCLLTFFLLLFFLWLSFFISISWGPEYVIEGFLPTVKKSFVWYAGWWRRRGRRRGGCFDRVN